MLPWMGLASDGGFGNSAALNTEGKAARQALEAARATIASLIGAAPPEIVFTSGGTESNNTLIAGLTEEVRIRQGMAKGGNLVVTSAFEHHAVLEPATALKRKGWLVELVRPNRFGFIEPEELSDLIESRSVGSDTKCTLVSVMTANNEVGTIQPITELTHVAHQHAALMHTDAVSALGKTFFDVRQLGVDAASFSAHKIGGPKGVGAFYLRLSTPFRAQQLGGGQEREMRSGTVNIAGAVGFAKALELSVVTLAEDTVRLQALRDRLVDGLTAASSKVSLTVKQQRGSRQTEQQPVTQAEILPGILSILVDDHQSETMILKLDECGFAVSGGSACTSTSLQPSHVLLAMGINRREAQSVLRLSIGHQTTAGDIDTFIRAFASIVS
jgi:cysteine desulfurase